MPYQFPPWIKPADPVTHYLRGMELGQQIASRQAVINEAQQRLQIQREQAAAQAARDMVTAEIRKATMEANIGLREEALRDARERAMRDYELNAIRTQAAGQAAQQRIGIAQQQAGIAQQRADAASKQAEANMLRAKVQQAGGGIIDPEDRRMADVVLSRFSQEVKYATDPETRNALAGKAIEELDALRKKRRNRVGQATSGESQVWKKVGQWEMLVEPDEETVGGESDEED